jgi:hypothetical protein
MRSDERVLPWFGQPEKVTTTNPLSAAAAVRSVHCWAGRVHDWPSRGSTPLDRLRSAAVSRSARSPRRAINFSLYYNSIEATPIYIASAGPHTTICSFSHTRNGSLTLTSNTPIKIYMALCARCAEGPPREWARRRYAKVVWRLVGAALCAVCLYLFTFGRGVTRCWVDVFEIPFQYFLIWCSFCI